MKVGNIPHCDLPPKTLNGGTSQYFTQCRIRITDDTYALVAVGGSVIRDVVPCHRRGFAHDTPVLLSFLVNAHNGGFDAADA